jgi:phytoene desaturase
MNDHSSSSRPSRAIVIGAGLGGLSAAMRLGAKGYQVTLLDRLDRAGRARILDHDGTGTGSTSAPPS